MKGLFILVITSFLTVFTTAQIVQDHLRDTLNSKWVFSAADEANWRDAQVPGCIHTDLLHHGVIADPFTGIHEKDCQWVGESDWIYRTAPFSVPAKIFQKEHIQLRFNGLDTYAEVYLNNQLILRADNAFRTWEADVKPSLQASQNILEIRFRSPVAEGKKRLELLPYPLPGDGLRAVTRKPQFHFGWDWGPTLITCGITAPIEWVAWNHARFEDVYIRQDRLSEDQVELTAILQIEVSKSDPCSLFFHIEETGDVYKALLDLRKGMNQIELPLEIFKPQLWWCNGQGEPALYSFNLSLRSKGQFLDRRSLRFGVRSLELITQKDQHGENFYFELNGSAVFAKGANMIPMTFFPAQAGEKEYRDLLTRCKESHFNMIRVWGGGVYEKDIFYDLCDELGIMVWQDFMFACSMYPADTLFIPNVIAEAEEQTRRLRNHASIALWCGNNENAEGWERWGWQTGLGEKQKARIKRAYDDLFQRTLPPIVKKNTTTSYWESSPRFGRGDKRSLLEGDCHYWGVWHDEEPFEILKEKIPRFMSEFGMQSYPSENALSDMTQGELVSPDHPGFIQHQKHPKGFELMNTYMKKWYPEVDPADIVLYGLMTQVVQAEGMCMGIEAHRRSAPYCMGTLFWQLNDVWPAFSWSSIDSKGKEKLFFHMLKEAYAPQLLSASLEGQNLRVHYIDDRVQGVTQQLVLKIVIEDWEGKKLYEETLPPSTLSPGVSHLLTRTSGEMNGLSDYRDKIIRMTLTDTNGSTVLERMQKITPQSNLFLIPTNESGTIRYKVVD